VIAELYTICSEEGDEYKLQFTTDRSGIIADALLDKLNENGIEVVEIGLGRVNGVAVTNNRVLAQIEECIADLLKRHHNIVLSFFCDFINYIPATKKKIPVQEYRSRLFELMFNRYVSLHNIDNMCNKVVKIEGVAEDFYFHIIYRQEHLKYAEMIAEGHLNDFGKPDEE
jgi:hypothetical protein